MDSIIEVVRCFENSNIIHVDGVINPINDIEIIELELIYADLETVSKRRERVKKQLKADKSLAKEDQILERLEKILNEGKSARSIEFTKEEKEIIKGLHLLTLKPLMYVAKARIKINLRRLVITKTLKRLKNMQKVKMQK